LADPVRVLGVIPARYRSTRLPGKALVPVCGRPLIAWVLERATASRRLDRVVVATDDSRIREAVEALGGRAEMTDPAHPSGTDRVAEVAARHGGDVVVNIQGDEALIEPALIDRVADALLEDLTWDMSTAATPFRSAEDFAAPSNVKVVSDQDGAALYFSRAPIPFDRDGRGFDACAPLYRHHVGIYGYRTAFLQQLVRTPPSPLEELEQLEQLRALHIGCRMKVVHASEPAIGLDTPEELPKVEAELRARGFAG
jgi:3-deoxy-manno-octulosonate cytidylyltransferase (CMP-KDO synthetase)